MFTYHFEYEYELAGSIFMNVSFNDITAFFSLSAGFVEVNASQAALVIASLYSIEDMIIVLYLQFVSNWLAMLVDIV